MRDSSTRIRCPHGEECGACALLGVDYDDQLERKREMLGRTLGRYPGLRAARAMPCLASPVVSGYRNRAKMAVGMSTRSGIRVGYFRKGTREIVDAPDCRVLVPELLETTRRVRGFLESTRYIPKALRYIDVRCGSDPRRQHLTLVFRTTELPQFPLEKLADTCPAVDGYSYNLNPSTGPQVIRGSVKPLEGEREVWVDHAGFRLRVSPGAFFQVNLALLPKIHEMMEQFFGHGESLADLYSGVGTHGLALSGRFRRVFFAEGNRSAVADLKATIRKHGVSDARVSAVSVERGLNALAEAAPDAVILNPSRAGVHESVLETIGRSPAAKIAYLSCDPATLCRDLDLLRRRGFTTRSVQPIDMMPQTRQVEALALLSR